VTGFIHGIRPRKQTQPAKISEGGTNATTRQEAVAELGVPDLAGNNVFTGTLNRFSNRIASDSVSAGTLQASTAVAFDVATISINTNDLTFPLAFATYDFPSASGTIALSGDPLRVPYNAQGSSYAASDADCVISATGTITVTLPAVSGVSGKMLWVKNAGVGTVTVDGYGTETIDGALTATLAAGAAIHVVSNGSNWLVL